MVLSVVPSGDEAKSWPVAKQVFDAAFENECSKRTVFVAVGGGAVLNMVGWVASCLYRGSKLVYIPTTFLAAHDVITSLKTAICYADKKNNIGHFFPATLSLVDTLFLKTLPQEEIVSGLGELAKNALVLGGDHATVFAEILKGSSHKDRLNSDQLLRLLLLGIEAKMGILKRDAREKKLGMMFEYGHTVAHALEKAYLETPGAPILPHGCAVAYGMQFCSYVAQKEGIMDEATREAHDEICRMVTDRYTLPMPLPDLRVVMDRAMHDSKRGVVSEQDDEFNDLLLFGIGKIRKGDHPSMLTAIKNKHLTSWWREFVSQAERTPGRPAKRKFVDSGIDEKITRQKLSNGSSKKKVSPVQSDASSPENFRTPL